MYTLAHSANTVLLCACIYVYSSSRVVLDVLSRYSTLL
jgi:hypothetical protein